MAGIVKLKIVAGPIQGKLFEFREHDTFIFGRAPDCHARLPENDGTVSRHHFILEVNPPDARVRDLGSLNGTYVNDRKFGGRAAGESAEEAGRRHFPEIDLRGGDRIRAGESVFAVAVEVEQRPARPEPILCKQCGKDVSEEVGQGRRGDYVCRRCQQAAENDPAAVLLKLLMDRMQGPSAPGIPGYDLGKMLGRGGMGAVYLARRQKDSSEVALKVMLSKVAVDEDSRKIFQREIEITRGLKHPNCVELLDHGSAGSGFYFAMELCPGGSVDGLMQLHGGKLNIKQAGSIMLQALEGLAFAHSRGFVHRDLKPQNILLTRPEGGVAKVSDFGLAKNFEKAGFSGMTATGAVSGTMPFMAREQVTNYRYVKPVSDVWSMGATLYCLLTGQVPRDFKRGQDPMEAILRGNVVPIRKRDPQIPKPLAEVIDRSLSDSIKERYQSATEFRDALSRAL